jgi:hypothetical protein
MGRAANQNVNDSCEFTVTGSHLIDLDRQAVGVASALGDGAECCRLILSEAVRLRITLVQHFGAAESLE